MKIDSYSIYENRFIQHCLDVIKVKKIEFGLRVRTNKKIIKANKTALQRFFRTCETYKFLQYQNMEVFTISKHGEILKISRKVLH